MTSNRLNDKDFYESLGKQLKEYRRKKGMTQGVLAEVSGLKRTSITNIESGKQKFPIHVLVAICYALEIELNDLVPSVSKLFGDKVTKVEYFSVGSTTKPVSEKMANVLSKIQKDLQEDS